MKSKQTVADPGFPGGGGANPPGEALTYDFAKFSQKLHEIERIWIPGASLAPPSIRHWQNKRKRRSYFEINTFKRSIRCY